MTPAQIVVGSKNSFSIFLRDENGNPVSLSAYISGTLTFKNKAGVVTVIELTVPSASPGRGELPVVITALEAASADGKWTSADLALIDNDDEPTVVPLPDAFEVIFPVN